MIVGKPLVSVIVACRNEARWIRETINSVLAQTYSDLELVVVDDGSTDNTAAIVASIPDPRLRLIRQAPAGACAARNAGLRLATGDLIQMLDGDDLLAADKIEHQVDRWRELGDSYVYFGPFARFSRRPGQRGIRPQPNWTDMDGHAWLVSTWTNGDMMAPHAWLTPAALVREAGPWNESLQQNQDGDYFSRVLLASAGVRYCPQALSYYRVGVKHSISVRSDRPARSSRLYATRMIARRLLAQDSSQEVRYACANAYEEQMLLNWVEHPDLAAEARMEMDALGGSDGRQPFRSDQFRWSAKLLGWRLACQIQQRMRRLREGTPAGAHGDPLSE